MKILHIVHALDQRSGGPLRAVLDLSFSWLSNGMECEAVGVGEYYIPDNPLQEYVIHSCRRAWPQSYSYSPQLRTWLRNNVRKFDGAILHGMWSYPNLVGAQECIRAGIPYACFPHGMLEPWAVGGQGWWKRFKKTLYWHLVEKYIFGKAQSVIFTTKREYELAKTVFSLIQLSTVLPPFGVHGLATAASKPLDHLILKVTESRYVLFLGRIHPKKNLDFLLRAWSQAEVQRDFRLVIAGPPHGKYLNDLKATVECLKLSNDVVFLDFVSGNDKLYLLQNAKWLLLPSKQENFGITVLEAMQNGCPVAVSDEVFLADELRDRAVVLKLSLDDWVHFFRHEMMNEASRGNYVEKGKSFLMENYEIEQIAKLWHVFMTSLFCFRRLVGPARVRALQGE